MDNLPLLRANHVKHKSNGSSFARRSTYIGKKKYARFGLALLLAGWLAGQTSISRASYVPLLLSTPVPWQWGNGPVEFTFSQLIAIRPLASCA